MNHAETSTNLREGPLVGCNLYLSFMRRVVSREIRKVTMDLWTACQWNMEDL